MRSAATAAVLMLPLGACGGAKTGQSSRSTAPTHPQNVTQGAPPRAKPEAPPVSIAQRVLTFVDDSRTVRLGGIQRPRTLLTIVRYPLGLHRRVPLIAFGHALATPP